MRRVGEEEKPRVLAGVLLRLMYLFVASYLERRRALMRARAEAKNAPAEPTTARMAVGFSGELAQPSWACIGRATARRRAKPRNARADFFMMISIGEVIDTVKGWPQISICERGNTCFVCTILRGKKKECDLVHSGDSQLRWTQGVVFSVFARDLRLNFFCESCSYSW